MEKTIYMPLVGEGTDCWRPVRAVQIEDDIFEVADGSPEGESWAFASGSRVRCKDKVFQDGETGLAAFAYAVESNPHYRLLKSHQRERFRVVFVGGEHAIIRVVHVHEEYEDFVYEMVSTNLEQKYVGKPQGAAYVAKFDDIVSAQLAE